MRLMALSVVVLAACGPGDDAVPSAEVEAATALSPSTFLGDEEDWGIVRDKARWAFQRGLDTLPIGQIIARIGQTFVGTEYAAHTLEVSGEERLVVELNQLDCVTFVENVLALARFVQSVPEIMLDDTQGRYRFMYAGILSRIRYRGGEMDRYPSRLHYFSEWITDKDEMGIVRNVSRELGGLPDAEPIDFMTTHPDAYRQLGETPEFVDEIRAIEARLSEAPRVYIPEDRIAEAAGGIQSGDIIAATSTVKGLDIAHTGIAVWVDGELRLLHAPLTEGTVRISDRSLARRIREISGQDGIMVARPMEAAAR